MIAKLFCLFMLILPARFAAVAADPADRAAELIKAGNMAELGKMFSSTVDVTLLSNEQMYSAGQATASLDKFFKANPVRSAKVIHRINSNPTMRYAVIAVVTANGNYRVSISLKAANGDFQINEVRVEADKG